MITLAASLGCAAHKQIQPFTILGKPGLVYYSMPSNCFEAYRVDAPHTREAIAVLWCHKGE